MGQDGSGRTEGSRGMSPRVTILQGWECQGTTIYVSGLWNSLATKNTGMGHRGTPEKNQSYKAVIHIHPQMNKELIRPEVENIQGYSTDRLGKSIWAKKLSFSFLVSNQQKTEVSPSHFPTPSLSHEVKK